MGERRLPFFSADECSADRRIQGDAGLSYFRAEFRCKSASSLPRRLQCPDTHRIRTSFFLQSSAISDCIRCTSPSGWLEFARVSTRDLLSQCTSADCQSSFSSSHEIALTIADFTAWYELLHRPVGACHRSMMSSPLIATIPAPPSVVPSCVDPSVYTWMSVGTMLLLLSTPLHQRAASRVQHPKSCGSQQSLAPGGKERLHFVGIRPEVQARKGGW